MRHQSRGLTSSLDLSRNLWEGNPKHLCIIHVRQKFQFRELSGTFNFSGLRLLLTLCRYLYIGSYELLSCNRQTTNACCFLSALSNGGQFSMVGESVTWPVQPNLSDLLGFSSSFMSSGLLPNFSYLSFLISKIRVESKYSYFTRGLTSTLWMWLFLLVAVTALIHAWLRDLTLEQLGARVKVGKQDWGGKLLWLQ